MAEEIGDSWDNPATKELRELKQRFAGSTVNPFTNRLLELFGSPKDSVYSNSLLKDSVYTKNTSPEIKRK